ncbi:MAG: hypothetical protein ACRBBN_14090 [Methyloligellaceae bacterium]
MCDDPIQKRYVRDLAQINDSFCESAAEKIISSREIIEKKKRVCTDKYFDHQFTGAQTRVLCGLYFAIFFNKYGFDSECMLSVHSSQGLNYSKLEPYYVNGYAQFVPTPFLDYLCSPRKSEEILIKEKIEEKNISTRLKNPKFMYPGAAAPTVTTTLKILEGKGLVEKIQPGQGGFDDGALFTSHKNASHWEIEDECRNRLLNWFDEYIAVERHNLVAQAADSHRKKNKLNTNLNHCNVYTNTLC